MKTLARGAVQYSAQHGFRTSTILDDVSIRVEFVARVPAALAAALRG